MSVFELLTPLNCGLAIVFLFFLKNLTTSNARSPPPYVPPEPIVLKDFTPKDLLAFDGTNNSKIYMGVGGKVYDVTRGKDFYGPGGPYANFAGHDASRGLAKHRFDAEMLADSEGLIDKLEDLDAEEREALAEWAAMFASKYDLVGSLVENEGVKTA
ncbi:cytochrome b5 [Fimicolochytrium jonesii]|uniref:cytochrome b5 n=1 Tax=Fimicolochytrium jonesii TaxID=1396493 RepID=UPI0022FE767E|nr:cytochrome b5 [Fimicolochytrium jonesii]KAI8821413.1 cytochrome b5 [Fimicolochytrium jonesii]